MPAPASSDPAPTNCETETSSASNSLFGRLRKSMSAAGDRREADRALKFESLEERCVLSATGIGVDLTGAAPSDSQFIASESLGTGVAEQDSADVKTEFTSITVKVNDQIHKFNPANETLKLAAGDKFQVIDVEFDSNAEEGVLAIESYLNKLQPGHSASLVDYNDGRFSLIEDNFAANGGSGSIDGTSDGWAAEAGWDRLTVSLVHYTADNTEIASRAIIQLQVEQPDFAFDVEAFEKLQASQGRVGEAFEIYGSWTNLGGGKFHNYAEVDVHHSSNPEKIVWAGALAGNASDSDRVEGYFCNTREGDGFSEQFTPTEEGTYIFRFYLDPEKLVAESDESNNRFDVKVEVLAGNDTPFANADEVETRMGETLDKIDVLANDYDADGDKLSVSEVTAPKHGKVAINEDGTLAYKSERGFVGQDEFQYRATDGEAESELTTVRVNVLPDGFKVESIASGSEDSPIKLNLEADQKQFSHVRFSGIPEGAELNRGKVSDDGSVDVSVKQLKNLTVTPAKNSDADFSLVATPVDGKTAYEGLAQTIDVNVEAVADGGKVDVSSFAIVTDSSGTLPMRFGFDDLDGSEKHTVTFHGLPDFVSLSAGQQQDGAWVLGYEDLEGLQIKAGRPDDLSGFKSSKWGDYQYFRVKVVVESVEESGESAFAASDEFKFLAVNRR